MRQREGSQEFYHGSQQASLRVLAARTGARQFDNATSQLGAFVTDDLEYAKRYAGKGGVVYKVILDLQKPYEMDFREFNKFQSPNKDAQGMDLPGEQWGERLEELKQEASGLRAKLETEGFDGIVIKGSGLRPTEVASFGDIVLGQEQEVYAKSLQGQGGSDKELDRLLAGLPIVEDARLANDSRTKQDGIHIGPSFAGRSERTKRAILVHESAHWFGLDDWYLANHEDWNLASKTEYGHLNGQIAPGEIMVEAYATWWMDPEYLLSHAPELMSLVEEGARAVGLPLPEDRTIETPGI